MPSTKAKILRLLSGIILKRATVVAAEDIGGFRRLVLQGKLPPAAAGTKVQLLLPSDDARTYSPIESSEGMLLLGWKHASGPGAHWLTNVRAGDEISFVGPQRSLELPPGPVLLVGDETSVAVAASFEAERPGNVHAVIQAVPNADVQAAAASVGLHHVDVIERGDNQATADAVLAQRSAKPDSIVVLTGCSELVVAVRTLLRAANFPNITTKAYWIPGKTGLD